MSEVIKRLFLAQSYLRELLRAMKNHDVKVMGYLAWSLIDSYEWSADTRCVLLE